MTQIKEEQAAGLLLLERFVDTLYFLKNKSCEGGLSITV